MNVHLNKSDNPSVWHVRMGHPSEKMLHHLPISLNKESSLSMCEICQLSKQTKQPFPISHTRSDEILDLLHMDVWGPYRQKSHTGAHYFLTVIDDHSRAT